MNQSQTRLLIQKRELYYMAIFLSFLFFHVIYEIVILLHVMQSISILRHGCMSASVIISVFRSMRFVRGEVRVMNGYTFVHVL
jgi:hypothetical protein